MIAALLECTCRSGLAETAAVQRLSRKCRTGSIPEGRAGAAGGKLAEDERGKMPARHRELELPAEALSAY